MSISVPVSFGEVFDKLSILDIKKIYFTDIEKLKHIENERICILTSLDKLSCPAELYIELVKINIDIWIRMEQLRDTSIIDDMNRWNQICRETLDLNDARFKVKNNINIKMNSLLRECKSY